ncbi:MAG TPA: two-component system response regulator [Opitutae bacterium]|nr:two-component system response regulator [Puniceicoccaceae bacterium]HBR95299.1 two-component system response regulator [Opitutae bacterium]|tara:strand:- start:21794 stop:22219 length:426 start_codon:yes stop_codon:yes gene_type:complete
MQLVQNKCLNANDPVVVVDDSVIDLTITKRVYARSELKNPLLTFTSGGAFLKHMEAVQNGVEPVPALVLMDINMPELNGFETIRKLRSVSDFSKIPVIVMLTNSDSDQDLERSLEVGANGFQTKDFDIARYTEFFNSLAAE